MVNLIKIVGAISIFIAAYMCSIILMSAVPYITDAGETIYPAGATDITPISWMLVLVTIIFGIIIMPSYLYVTGIQEEDKLAPFMRIILAFSIFLIGILLTIKGWFFITALGGASSESFLIAIYWIMAIAMWVGMVFVTPAYIIVNTMQGEGK